MPEMKMIIIFCYLLIARNYRLKVEKGTLDV